MILLKNIFVTFKAELRTWRNSATAWGGKGTQSYLGKSKDTIIEYDSSKSESHPVKYYLSKSLKVFGFKYT